MTLEECLTICLKVVDKVIPFYCAGVDYESVSGCFIHSDQTIGGVRSSTPGVTHYKRKTCGMF